MMLKDNKIETICREGIAKLPMKPEIAINAPLSLYNGVIEGRVRWIFYFIPVNGQLVYKSGDLTP